METALKHLGIDRTLDGFYNGENSRDGLSRNLIEAEADCFAGELLIPEKACYELAQLFQGRFGRKLDVLVGRLAPEFLVSKQPMKRRLMDLKIVEKLPRVEAIR